MKIITKYTKTYNYTDINNLQESYSRFISSIDKFIGNKEVRILQITEELDSDNYTIKYTAEIVSNKYVSEY